MKKVKSILLLLCFSVCGVTKIFADWGMGMQIYTDCVPFLFPHIAIAGSIGLGNMQRPHLIDFNLGVDHLTSATDMAISYRKHLYNFRVVKVLQFYIALGPELRYIHSDFMSCLAFGVMPGLKNRTNSITNEIIAQARGEYNNIMNDAMARAQVAAQNAVNAAVAGIVLPMGAPAIHLPAVAAIPAPAGLGAGMDRMINKAMDKIGLDQLNGNGVNIVFISAIFCPIGFKYFYKNVEFFAELEIKAGYMFMMFEKNLALLETINDKEAFKNSIFAKFVHITGNQIRLPYANVGASLGVRLWFPKSVKTTNTLFEEDIRA